MIVVGSAYAALRQLPDGFAQCCVTSPPYWSLRDYDLPGHIGGEPKLATYMARLSRVFKQLRRVVAEDGTLWLNIGDAYTSGNRGWRAPDKRNPARAMDWRPDNPPGLKDKELIGLPWRLARLLQRQGWYLRSEVIWFKPNAQPESVKDRPTRAHEHMFLFSNSAQYQYDSEVIAETANGDGAVKNRRSVWTIPTEPFNGSHFAVFPQALVEVCIRASSRPGQLVIDPFFGAGTVGLVCQQERRNFMGVELNPTYAELARERLGLSTASVIPVSVTRPVTTI